MANERGFEPALLEGNYGNACRLSMECAVACIHLKSRCDCFGL